jgi:hypothetical protein
MKTIVKLVIAGMIAGVIGCSGSAEAPRTEREREAVTPIDTPDLEPELANTHTNVEVPIGVDPVRAEPEPVRESFDPVLANGDVRVRRLIVATGTSRHEPTGASDTFEIGAQERIYAFVDAVNETDEPAELYVTFEPARGEIAGHVSLEVPANVPRFRTWAWTRHVYTEGRWEVVVRDADDRVIARRPFEVVR